MRLASSFLFAFVYEKVGFFILFGANFHFMWCRLPASCVSSRFASFLVCIWTRVLGRRRLKRLSLLGLSTSPLPRARADLLVVQETPKTHPKRLSLLGLSTSPSWPATIQLCGFSILRSRAQPTGQWGRKSVDCMLGTVEGFAFGKVGFAFYLTDRVCPSNLIRKPTSNCSTEPDHVYEFTYLHYIWRWRYIYIYIHIYICISIDAYIYIYIYLQFAMA